MLNHKDIEKTPIKELVSGNYVFAAVLHYFGISFFQYEGSSLQEVCEKHRIKPKQLIHELESWALRKEPSPEELFLRPIEVLVAYLKKSTISLFVRNCRFYPIWLLEYNYWKVNIVLYLRI